MDDTNICVYVIFFCCWIILTGVSWEWNKTLLFRLVTLLSYFIWYGWNPLGGNALENSIYWTMIRFNGHTQVRSGRAHCHRRVPDIFIKYHGYSVILPLLCGTKRMHCFSYLSRFYLLQVTLRLLLNLSSMYISLYAKILRSQTFLNSFYWLYMEYFAACRQTIK